MLDLHKSQLNSVIHRSMATVTAPVGASGDQPIEIGPVSQPGPTQRGHAVGFKEPRGRHSRRDALREPDLPGVSGTTRVGGLTQHLSASAACWLRRLPLRPDRAPLCGVVFGPGRGEPERFRTNAGPVLEHRARRQVPEEEEPDVFTSLTDQEREELSRKLKEKNRQSSDNRGRR